ncbi:MAG: hypothetical protein MAG451_00679 [Anaerolineales bacterium]|nr:hypothetical protein [Anaerolineales bacterium]
MKTLTLHCEISPSREINIKVPDEVPLGPAEVVIVIASPAEAIRESAGTAGDMLQSPLFGLWADREDIGDSVEYARQLRTQAEQRNHG